VTGSKSGARPWLPYVLHYGLYLAFLGVQGQLAPGSLVWVYPLKTLVVAGALLAFRRSYVELRPSFSLLAVAIGVRH
jgi:hypothetical protein